MNANPRFPVILSARGNTDRPSELEVHLRAHCGRLMVKPSLSGAHLHFPSEKLAVRVYYPIDIRALEQEYHAMNGTKDIISIIQEPMSDKDDLDGLVAFSKMFALSLVLFVLPDTHFNEQLGRVDSFTFRAQRLLETTNTRVLPVTSTQMAIDSIITFAEAMNPERVKLKKAFFDRQAKDDPRSRAIHALSEWCSDQDLQTGEKELLMHTLRTFYGIATADTAAVEGFAEETQAKLLSFFQTTGSDDDDEEEGELLDPNPSDASFSETTGHRQDATFFDPYQSLPGSSFRSGHYSSFGHDDDEHTAVPYQHGYSTPFNNGRPPYGQGEDLSTAPYHQPGTYPVHQRYYMGPPDAASYYSQQTGPVPPGYPMNTGPSGYPCMQPSYPHPYYVGPGHPGVQHSIQQQRHPAPIPPPPPPPQFRQGNGAPTGRVPKAWRRY